MNNIIRHIKCYLFGLICSGMLCIPLQSKAQISSCSVMILPTPIIDSVTYSCQGWLPIIVHVSNQISTCVYSVVNTVPNIGPVASNDSGVFILDGATDAVFRVHNGACYTDTAIHFDCNGMPLPIKLIDFSVRLYNTKEALISWKVSDDERSIERFEVEESFDGRSFHYLAKVNPKNGAGTQEYELVDGELFKGYNYYRLKMIDHDGVAHYSPVRFVIYSVVGDIVWYPNPTDHYIYIEFYNEDRARTINVRLYNVISGLEQSDRTYELSPGYNKIAIDVRQLSDATYFLKYEMLGDQPKQGVIRFQKVTR